MKKFLCVLAAAVLSLLSVAVVWPMMPALADETVTLTSEEFGVRVVFTGGRWFKRQSRDVEKNGRPIYVGDVVLDEGAARSTKVRVVLFPQDATTLNLETWAAKVFNALMKASFRAGVQPELVKDEPGSIQLTPTLKLTVWRKQFSSPDGYANIAFVYGELGVTAAGPTWVWVFIRNPHSSATVDRIAAQLGTGIYLRGSAPSG